MKAYTLAQKIALKLAALSLATFNLTPVVRVVCGSALEFWQMPFALATRSPFLSTGKDSLITNEELPLDLLAALQKLRYS